jgi:hypothetical protein
MSNTSDLHTKVYKKPTILPSSEGEGVPELTCAVKERLPVFQSRSSNSAQIGAAGSVNGPGSAMGSPNGRGSMRKGGV